MAKNSVKKRRANRNYKTAKLMQNLPYNRFDIIVADLGRREDGLAFGKTICIVISNGNDNSNILVIPVVKRVNDAIKDCFIMLKECDCKGFRGTGYLQMYGIRPVNKRCVTRRVGEVRNKKLQEAIDEAIKTEVGLRVNVAS